MSLADSIFSYIGPTSSADQDDKMAKDSASNWRLPARSTIPQLYTVRRQIVHPARWASF
jgi:hypothetical protein